VRLQGVTDCETFPSLAQARAWATKREAEILAGHRGLPTSHTVADAIDRFIRDVCPKRKGGRWESVRLAKFRRDKIALRPLSKLTSDDIARWRDARLAEVSPGSVAREMNLWGALFSIAVREWRWIHSSPVKGVKRPSDPPARRRGITEDEVSCIVKHLKNGRLGEVKMAFLLSLETAMRAGEILGLTWDNVDLQRRVVTLPKTKNGDSRQVPLSTAAVAICNALKVAEVVGEASPKEVASRRMFAISSATLDTLFRRARSRAIADCPSVATVRFHDARSEAITRLSRKVDVLQLARIVGHRNLASLMFYYSESAEEIAKKLD